jgi:hypothetical protein
MYLDDRVYMVKNSSYLGLSHNSTFDVATKVFTPNLFAVEISVKMWSACVYGFSTETIGIIFTILVYK